MADVKDGDIVFEYPDDDEIPAAKPAEEKEVSAKTEKNEVKVETKAADIDLEIEDDTPAEDRNRQPMPKEIVEKLDQEELESYSDDVRQKFKQLKNRRNDTLARLRKKHRISCEGDDVPDPLFSF